MAVVQLKKVPDGMELEDVTEEEQKEMLNNLHKEPEEITDIKIIEVEEIPDDVKVVEVEEEKANEFVGKVEVLKEESKIETGEKIETIYIGDTKVIIEKDNEEERVAVTIDENGIKNKATYNKKSKVLVLEEILNGITISEEKINLEEKETKNIGRKSSKEKTFTNYEFSYSGDKWKLRAPAKQFSFHRTERKTIINNRNTSRQLGRFQKSVIRINELEELIVLGGVGMTMTSVLSVLTAGGNIATGGLATPLAVASSLSAVGITGKTAENVVKLRTECKKAHEIFHEKL